MLASTLILFFLGMTLQQKIQKRRERTKVKHTMEDIRQLLLERANKYQIKILNQQVVDDIRNDTPHGRTALRELELLLSGNDLECNELTSQIVENVSRKSVH